MKTILVRYKTTPAHAETNVKLVHSVFDELRASAPAGFRYATYCAQDGVSFVHIATTEGDSTPLSGLTSFKAFQKEIKERCVELPVVTELTAVDSYAAVGS